MEATKRPTWRILKRNRVSKTGVPTFDIMEGDGNPENWEMVAERIEGEDLALDIIQAVNLFPEMVEALKRIEEQLLERDKRAPSYISAIIKKAERS